MVCVIVEVIMNSQYQTQQVKIEVMHYTCNLLAVLSTLILVILILISVTL